MNKNNPRRRLAAFLGAVGLSLLTGAPLALADDTEVYVSNSTEGSQPNILFIVDTSGSMSTEVTIPAVYDPATTYTGSCSSSRIYWSTTVRRPPARPASGSPPPRTTARPPWSPLASSGRFTDQAAMWRRDWGLFGERSFTDQRWQSLQAGANSHALECEDDSGKHGSADGVWYADKDARNSSNKWNSAASQEIRLLNRLQLLVGQLPQLVGRDGRLGHHRCHPAVDRAGRGQEAGRPAQRRQHRPDALRFQQQRRLPGWAGDPADRGHHRQPATPSRPPSRATPPRATPRWRKPSGKPISTSPARR